MGTRSSESMDSKSLLAAITEGSGEGAASVAIRAEEVRVFQYKIIH